MAFPGTGYPVGAYLPSGFPLTVFIGSVFEIWLASLALYKALKRVPRETFKTDILSVLVQDRCVTRTFQRAC